MSDTHHIKYRPDIDGLRAVAVIAVVLFHGFPDYVRGGFIGVDIFFVISGYLISTILFSNLANDEFSFIDFYSRRIKRIFPALLVILVATFIFGWFCLTPREYEVLNQEIAGGAAFFSNFIFWRQSGYFDLAADKKPLLHLWSLAVEEQFYIFWPLILWFFYRLRANLLYLTVCILVISFGLNIAYIGIDPVGDFYAPYTRFWELLFGGVLGNLTLFKLKKHLPPPRLNNYISLLGVCFIFYSIFAFNKSLAFPGWMALLPVVGATLVIYAGQNASINRLFLSNKLMVWVGLISYPLYLWHWPILSLAHIYFGSALTYAQVTLAILLSVLLAWLTYGWVEKPLRKSPKSGLLVIGLSILMVVIGATAYYVKEGEGLASRFSVRPLQRITQLTGCDNVIKNDILYPCTFGNLDSKETILIYGDSHAGHLTNALNYSLGSKYKFIFLGYGDCFLSKKEGADRDQMCQKMWGEIRRLRSESLYAVIHAQRWGVRGADDVKEQMQQAYKISGLSAKKIAIVGSIPNVDLDCAIANYYVSARQRNCQAYFNQYQANEEFMRITSALDRPNNLIFIYPHKKLCPNGGCKVIDDFTVNYWDDAHMSRDGAVMAIPDLIQFLQN